MALGMFAGPLPCCTALPIPRALSEDSWWVRSFSFTPDGRMLLCTGEHTVRKVYSGRALPERSTHYAVQRSVDAGKAAWTDESAFPAFSTTFSPDGRQLALGGWDSVWVKDLRTRAVRSLLSGDRVLALGYSPKGSLKAVVGKRGHYGTYPVAHMCKQCAPIARQEETAIRAEHDSPLHPRPLTRAAVPQSD